MKGAQHLKAMRDKISRFFVPLLDRTSLRKKILLNTVMLLLLLSLTIALITRTVFLNMLNSQFQSKGVSLARGLATKSIVDVLTHNKSRLERLINDEQKSDKDIAYAFILDPSHYLLAHTFSQGFPVDLIRANSIQKDKDIKIQLLDTQIGLIYDIAVPIISEKSVLGQVRLGLSQSSIRQTIMVLNLVFIASTLLAVLIGIFLAHRLSSMITKPISKLVEATQSIQKGDFSTQIDIKTKDEIKLLATSFNQMVYRLKQLIEEKQNVKALKERSRIAFDLHDGCAQDLASIIKRLELTQKLINADPTAALKEVEALREITKEALDRTRQLIFGLKSSADDEYDLLGALVFFLKDYEKANNVCVKCAICIPLNDISAANAKALFYIIKEAFTNIKKHSLARNVFLKLGTDREDNLIVNIKDDGNGFDVHNAQVSVARQDKWGLTGMRQKVDLMGGRFVVKSQPQQGTEIHINVPHKNLKEL